MRKTENREGVRKGEREGGEGVGVGGREWGRVRGERQSERDFDICPQNTQVCVSFSFFVFVFLLFFFLPVFFSSLFDLYSYFVVVVYFTKSYIFIHSPKS